MYSSMTSYPPPDQYPRLTKTISQSAAAGAGTGTGTGTGANFSLDMDVDMSLSVNMSAGGAFDPSDNSGLPETDWFSTNSRSNSNFNMSTLSPRVMTPLDVFGEGAAAGAGAAAAAGAGAGTAGAGAASGVGLPHMFQGTGAPATPTPTLTPTPPTPATPAPQWQQLLNDLHPYNTYTPGQPQSQSQSQSQAQAQAQPLLQSLQYLDPHHAHAHPQWESVWAAPPSPPPPFVAAHQLSVSSSSSVSPSSDSDSLPSQGSPTSTPTPAPHMLMSNQGHDTYTYTATPALAPTPAPAPQPIYKTEPVEPEPSVDPVPTPSHSTRGKPKATAPSRNEPQMDTSSMSPRARHRSVEAKRRAKEMAAMNELMELHRLRHEHDAAPIALEEEEEDQDTNTNTNTRTKAKGKQKAKGKAKAKVAASDKAAVLAETAQVIKALSARVAELSRALEQQSSSAQAHPQPPPHSPHDASRSSAHSSGAHGKRKHGLEDGWVDAGAGAGAGADSVHLLELDSRATKTRLLDPEHQQQVRFLTRWASDTQAQAQQAQSQSQSQSPIRGEWEDDSPVSLSPPSSSSPSSSSSSSPFSPSSSAPPPTNALMVLGCKLSPESPWALSLAGHVDRAARSVIDSSLHEHLFRNASVSIVVIDMLGRLIDCNTAFEEMTGMSRVAVAGKMMSAMSTFIPAITGRAPVTSVIEGLREQQRQQQQYQPQPLASMDPMFPFPETVLGLRKLVVKQEEAVAVIHRSCAFGTYKEVRVVHWLVSDSQGKPYAIVGCTTKDDLLYRGPIDAPATIERAKAARQHTVNSIEHLQQLLEALPLPSSDCATATATATSTST